MGIEIILTLTISIILSSLFIASIIKREEMGKLIVEELVLLFIMNVLITIFISIFVYLLLFVIKLYLFFQYFILGIIIFLVLGGLPWIMIIFMSKIKRGEQ